jgi:hypothetical protein
MFAWMKAQMKPSRFASGLPDAKLLVSTMRHKFHGSQAQKSLQPRQLRLCCQSAKPVVFNDRPRILRSMANFYKDTLHMCVSFWPANGVRL